MVERAESDLVLQQGFSGVAVVDPGEQASPGANRWLEHDRVAHFLDRLDRRFGREGDDGARSWHTDRTRAMEVSNLSPQTFATS